MPSTVSQHPVDAIFHASSECDTQMPSSVKANLLDDGIADTLGSVGATSGVHTDVSINASDSARSPSRKRIAIDAVDQPASHFDKRGSQPFARGASGYLFLGGVCGAPERTRVDAIGIDFQHRVVELARGRG
jgi:hypothetical protein